MAATSPEQIVTLVLSIFCGVLGIFLLTHEGVRMMKGGLLYRISVGLAAMGIVLSLNAGTKLFGVDPSIADLFLIVALVVLFYIGYSAWLSAHQMQQQARSSVPPDPSGGYARIRADMEAIWGEMAVAMLRKRMRDIQADAERLTQDQLRQVVHLLRDKPLPSLLGPDRSERTARLWLSWVEDGQGWDA